MISEERRGRLLLHQARTALAAALGREPPAQLPRTPEEEIWLVVPGATFVTLRLDRRLRGCIGSLKPVLPLQEDVAKNACAAAFDDPRFPPLTADEYPRLALEVSLLSAPEPLPPCPDRIAAEALLRPGEDGLIFEYRHHRSTFLPQVWESLPTPGEFLARLVEKAGLPAEFWAPEIHLHRYGAGDPPAPLRGS